MNKALIETATGLVVNIISLDPGAAYTPAAGHSVIDWATGCQIGGTWDGSVFQPRPPIDPAVLDAMNDLAAQQQLDNAIHKVVRDALWDMELRLRALGSTSAGTDIAAATTKADYTAALKTRIKSEL